MEEKKLLLGIIEDRYERFLNYYILVAGDFLNTSQQTYVKGFVKEHAKEGTFYYGGFPDAERRMVIFIPDYMNVKDENSLYEYFRSNPEDCPLAVVDVTAKKGGAKLTHRDYLGSLMGEGIKREKIGDILVNDDGAQIITTKEMAEYLELNYGHAGRVELSVKILPINCLKEPDNKIIEVKFTVPSPRLDNIVSAVFGVSRKDAVSAINQGMVFIDNMEINKPDYSLKGGEKVVMRGRGKAVYRGTSGTSKKGKIYISFDKYV